MLCDAIIEYKMDCCCPTDKEPQYGVYVNNLQSVRVTPQKSKFSFRTSTAPASSRVSHASNENEQHLDQELRRLQEEYQRLKEEEAVIDHFQTNRVRQLQQEVAFYEAEIRERTREIQELNSLFRLKLQERQQIQFVPVQQPFPVQIVHLPQPIFKTGTNDDTSISSIPPNS